jgi:thioredoxin-dependent peroxiredoxin
MPLTVGQAAPDFEIDDIHGATISPAQFRGRKLMIAFFRFAACPYCNLRMHELAAKAPTLKDHLEIIAIFQSPNETLQKHRNVQQFPAHIVGDVEMRVFKLYQGELSGTKFVTGHLRQPIEWVRGVQQGAFDAGRTVGELRLVPAEFLIDAEGIIQRAHYGRDVTDHLPMSEVMRFAR